MIQYSINITHPTALQQATEVIDGGCEWIEIDPAGTATDDLVKLMTPIIELCRDKGVILVVKHDDKALDLTRIHGIVLSKDGTSLPTLRQSLGGHPIVGVEHAVEDTADYVALQRDDADYIVYPTVDPATIERLTDERNRAASPLPIVARGKIDTTTAQQLLNAGAQGLAIDIESLDPNDIKSSFKALLDSLKTA